MSGNKLGVIAVEPRRPKTRREENQEVFEREWQENPDQFNSCRNTIERERIQRTWEMIGDVKRLRVVDIGCGAGELTKRAVEAGAEVTALDIATQALSPLSKLDVVCVQDCMPSTTLPDDFYDIVVCADLIAHITKKEHRLFVAELARVIKSDGRLICSTALDVKTDGALEFFLGLLETDFEIIDTHLSYFSWYSKVANLFPQSQSIMLFFEKMNCLLSSRGPSHVIVKARRRKLA